ncbi:hypothetical protein EI969_19485 [Pseudomonas sp. PB101]|nr:hypothetical protein [Pseudomonas sp. PB101]
MRSLVGASLLAMVVNDNACKPDKRGALESIAGKPAPTGGGHAGSCRSWLASEWSSTITRVIRINAAHLSSSPAS